MLLRIFQTLIQDLLLPGLEPVGNLSWDDFLELGIELGMFRNQIVPQIGHGMPLSPAPRHHLSPELGIATIPLR
jgi:hypothetical protein